MRHPELSGVRHFELYCLPELVSFYQRHGFSSDVGGIQLLRLVSESRLPVDEPRPCMACPLVSLYNETMKRLLAAIVILAWISSTGPSAEPAPCDCLPEFADLATGRWVGTGTLPGTGNVNIVLEFGWDTWTALLYEFGQDPPMEPISVRGAYTAEWLPGDGPAEMFDVTLTVEAQIEGRVWAEPELPVTLELRIDTIGLEGHGRTDTDTGDTWMLPLDFDGDAIHDVEWTLTKTYDEPLDYR